MEPIDMKYICRLCAKEDRFCIDVFGEDGNKNNISKKVRLCLPVTIKEDDVYPKQVCLSCLNKLDTSYELYSGCMNAQTTIKKLFALHRNFCHPNQSRDTEVERPIQQRNLIAQKHSSLNEDNPVLRVGKTVVSLQKSSSDLENSQSEQPRRKIRRLESDSEDDYDDRDDGFVTATEDTPNRIASPQASLSSEKDGNATGSAQPKQHLSDLEDSLSLSALLQETPGEATTLTLSTLLQATPGVPSSNSNVNNVPITEASQFAETVGLSTNSNNLTQTAPLPSVSTPTFSHSTFNQLSTNSAPLPSVSTPTFSHSTFNQLSTNSNNLMQTVSLPSVSAQTFSNSTFDQLLTNSNNMTQTVSLPTVSASTFIPPTFNQLNNQSGQFVITSSPISSLSSIVTMPVVSTNANTVQDKPNILLRSVASLQTNPQTHFQINMSEQNPSQTQDNTTKQQPVDAESHITSGGTKPTGHVKPMTKSKEKQNKRATRATPQRRNLTRTTNVTTSTNAPQPEPQSVVRSIRKKRNLAASSSQSADQQQFSSSTPENEDSVGMLRISNVSSLESMPSASDSLDSLSLTPVSNSTMTPTVINSSSVETGTVNTVTTTSISTITTGIMSTAVTTDQPSPSDGDNTLANDSQPIEIDDITIEDTTENPTLSDRTNSSSHIRKDNNSVANNNSKLPRINAQGEHLCQYCEKYFAVGIIVHHKTLHFRERFFCCISCGKNFRTEVGLECHRCEAE